MNQGRNKRTNIWLVGLLVVVLAALSGCNAGPKVDWDLNISGAVSNPITLSYKDLLKREQVELTEVLMRRSQGEDSLNSWSGPALAPILAEAGISADATMVTVMAADGYALQITVEELEGAIIALKMDGEWSADDPDHGPIRLVCPETSANFWIFQITDLIVE